MTKAEKIIHGLLISIVFSLFNWIVIDYLIVDIPVYKYVFVELLLVASMKFYIFTIQKFKLK